MTRDEKIEIIIRELAGIMPFDIRKERARILVDALEEPPAPTFRENEIVRFRAIARMLSALVGELPEAPHE